MHVTPSLTLKKGASAMFYRSGNYGHGSPVGFIVPAQDAATGPRLLVSGTKPAVATLAVVARARSTGKAQTLKLAGIRSTHCGDVAMNVMNASVSCGGGKAQSILILTVPAQDNADVPADVYSGSLRIEAKEENAKPLIDNLFFDYDITIAQDAAIAQPDPSGREPSRPDIDRSPGADGREPR